MRNIRNILSTFTLLVFAHNLYAQELSGIKEAKPVSISGSVNAGISYLDGIRNINDFPIGYNLGINLNLDFYSVFQIPFSFYFSNYGTGINTLSFKRFGISPSYKAIKLHLGYRSYVLSPYALTGMTMLGGGVELTLKKFNFLAFAGKVAEPYFMGNQYATFADSDIDFYKRWAYGVRLGFGKPSNSFKIHLFHAKDNPKTGSIDTLVRSQILPSENLVLGLETQQTIFKILTFSANGAASLFTPNLNGDPIKDNNKWLKGFNFINTTNSSSRMSFAYDAKISVRIKTMNVGFKYQHIDPFYSSLGVSFLQTNYNNYLADLSGSLFKGKLSLMSSVGFQVYNKDGYTGRPQRRSVYIVNVNYNVTKKLGLQGSYNNLSQNTMPTYKEVGDTIRLSTNYTGWNSGIQYKMGKKKDSYHSLYANASNSKSDLIHADSLIAKSKSLYSSLGYRYNINNKWNVGVSVDFTDFDAGDQRETRRIGVTGSYGITVAKYLNFRAQLSYRTNSVEKIKDGQVITSNFSIQYKHPKHHLLSLNINQLYRDTKILTSKNEFRVRLNYSYSFTSKNKSK